MFAAVMTLLFGYYATQFYFQVLQTQAVVQALKDDENKENVRRMAVAVESFYRASRRYPVDGAELGATVGTEWVAPYITGAFSRVRYARATGLAGSGVTYQRATAFYQNETAEAYNEDATDWLDTNNQCGGAYATSAEWCGPATASWYRVENRADLTERQIDTRRLMNVTLLKLLSRYVASNTFPNTTHSNPSQTVTAGATLAEGDTHQLRNLVRRLGTSFIGTDAFGCRGQFVFEDVVFDCGDLYSGTSGAPVYYTYSSPSAVVLSVDSGVTSSSGTPIQIAQELVF